MPLVALAYAAFAAGLLMGAGGELFPGGLVALGGLAFALVRGSPTPAALAVLLAAGTVLGASTAAADARCAERMERDGAATVVLREPAARGRGARGIAHGEGCEVATRLRVAGGAAPAGARVRVLGTARRTGAMLDFTAARIRVIDGPGVLARWRARAGTLIDSLYGSHAPLARALLIADERDIAPEVRRQFADSGIIHMLSVSGLHVAVLAEAIVLVTLMAGAPVRRAEVVAAATIAVFVAFVGAPSPAVRSAAMYIAVVLSRRLQRPTSPWALLALGAAVPLANPRTVTEIGYHLSVVGMAALISAGRLVRRLPLGRLPRWAQRLGRETVATVVASAASAPIVAWHFGRVSLASPVTNLAAAPLFGVAQPALFLSLALAPLRPAARIVADGAGVVLSGIDRVGALGAALPWSALDVVPTTATAWLAAAAVVAMLVACAGRYWGRPMAAGLLCVGGALWWPLLRPGGNGLELHLLDVGQGDAVALRTPRRRWILFDAGDAWRTGDAGERTVAPYLRRRGGEVALFVLSHPHADHIGGAAAVIRHVPVRAIWDGGYVQGSAVYRGVLDAARAGRVAWSVARPGSPVDIDGVSLTVLAPDSATTANARDANAASVVVMAEYQGARILFTGDMEREQEEALLRHADRLHADILKVGHHGSSTSSTEAFVDAVSPRLALVSVGNGNTYGHPSAAVIDRLRAHRARVMRTDDDGTVVVRVRDGWIRVSTDDGSWQWRTAPARAGDSTLAADSVPGPLSVAR